MKPPIELYRPTILNIIAIVSYCLATMFHIIAYATDNWASVLLGDVRWRLGLWQGCREEDEHCTTEVFEHDIFQTGSDWHTGARIMMTLTLIILFFLEFSLIGYACVKNLEKYRGQLVGITIALSLSAALLQMISLISYRKSLDNADDVKTKSPFGFVVLSIMLETTFPLITCLDRCKGYPTNLPESCGNYDREFDIETSDAGSSIRTNPQKIFTINDSKASLHTSMTSLPEVETYRKFAYAEDYDEDTYSKTTNCESVSTRVSYISDDTSVESRV